MHPRRLSGLPNKPSMDYLTCALDEANGGVATLEAMASTRAAQHAAVTAEVQQVLGWAWLVLDAEPTKVVPQDIAQIPVPSTWLDGERRFAA